MKEPHIICDVKVGIFLWSSPEEYSRRKKDNDQRKVHIKLTPNVRQQDVRDHFEQFGSIEDLIFKHDPYTNAFRNFCYITYYRQEDAHAAAMHRIHIVNDVELICEMCKPRRRSPNRLESQALSGENALQHNFQHGKNRKNKPDASNKARTMLTKQAENSFQIDEQARNISYLECSSDRLLNNSNVTKF